MADAKQSAAPKASEQVLEKGLLDQIVEQGRMAKDTGTKERGKDLVKEFVAQVLEGSMTVTRDAETMINARIAQIDHLLSIQLNEILHHPTFQKLEGSWRGLRYLLVRYGHFFAFVRATEVGHVTVALEPGADVVGLAGAIDALLGRRP